MIRGFSVEELTVLTNVVRAAQTMFDNLRTIEAWPRDWLIHIDSEIEPGYLGYVGFGEDGETAEFYPAPPLTQEKPHEDH